MNLRTEMFRPIVLSLLCCAAMVGCASQSPGAAGAAEAAPPADSRSLYLDVHDLGPGNVTADAVAEAHEKDLAVQGEYGVEFLKYWVDEETGKVVCLSRAPDAAAVNAAHGAAHGLLADEVLEVTEGE